MREHELNTDPAAYALVLSGAKTHDNWLNDRGIAVGDRIVLRETQNTGEAMLASAPLIYTGRSVVRIVSHIQTGPGLMPGWCSVSFRDEDDRVIGSFAPLEARRAVQAISLTVEQDRAQAGVLGLLLDDAIETLKKFFFVDGIDSGDEQVLFNKALAERFPDVASGKAAEAARIKQVSLLMFQAGVGVRKLLPSAPGGSLGAPDGWSIRRDDKGPFRGITVKSPSGAVTTVHSFDRNPSNIIYQLAEALLSGAGAETPHADPSSS